MSTTIIQEPTPSHVADLANETARLPALALIGIFGSAAAPTALIRERNGSIQRVTVGDAVAGQTVAAIDADRVILSNGGQTKTLSLPKS
ncbi:pilus assembly protein PilZ [Sulfitobacter sp. JBTF-M27]|uniref:Pilus assembly protein PilZ n=1 Tax=Sulfitobacter sediminilitoris TaxID=2698830 RepID=A0A6P0C787_9RHOB|nr:type II secretion system protein N [Sulfitobacter sediminilitoris]NEK20988.1 pilus assembly protein PilZ [Sulfitobacter sediminilitoris]